MLFLVLAVQQTRQIPALMGLAICWGETVTDTCQRCLVAVRTMGQTGQNEARHKEMEVGWGCDILNRVAKKGLSDKGHLSRNQKKVGEGARGCMGEEHSRQRK